MVAVGGEGIVVRMVSSSNLYSCSRRLYVLSLLYRKLMAAYLCWRGEGFGVGGLWNDRVCERGFSIHGCLPAYRGFVDGDIKVVYLVRFSFCSKPQCGVHCIEIV